VGIVQVRCDETACVKLYNPSVRQCWNLFRVGMRALADQGHFDPAVAERVEATVERELLAEVPPAPGDEILAKVYEDFLETARGGEDIPE